MYLLRVQYWAAIKTNCEQSMRTYSECKVYVEVTTPHQKLLKFIGMINPVNPVWIPHCSCDAPANTWPT